MSYLVILPFALPVAVLRFDLSPDNNFHMLLAVSCCAVLFYFVGIFLSKVLQFLRNVL